MNASDKNRGRQQSGPMMISHDQDDNVPPTNPMTHGVGTVGTDHDRDDHIDTESSGTVTPRNACSESETSEDSQVTLRRDTQPWTQWPSVIPISASDILPYRWVEQHIKAEKWVNPNPPPGKLGWATGEDWMIEKDEKDEPVLHIPEKFISGVEHVYGSLDDHQWFKTSSMKRPEETVRDAWSQIFFKFFPSGGVIQVRPEIAIPTLVAGVRTQEFLNHPLTKTQTSGGDSSALDQETESKPIGYVRPDLSLCTIDTAYLAALGTVSRAIAFWEVKKGDAHMKGFLQAVWALLVGWTLFGTEFSGLASHNAFMRIRIGSGGKIGVDVPSRETDLFDADTRQTGLTIADYMARAKLNYKSAFAHKLEGNAGFKVFARYCQDIGVTAFKQHFDPKKIGQVACQTHPLEIPRAQEVVDLQDKYESKGTKVQSRKRRRTEGPDDSLSKDVSPGPSGGAGGLMQADKQEQIDEIDKLELYHRLETEFEDEDWEMFHKLKNIRVWPYDALFP